MQIRVDMFSLSADNYESQAKQEDTNMIPDIYNSPTEYIPPGTEVQQELSLHFHLN